LVDAILMLHGGNMSRLACSCVVLVLAAVGISSCRCNPQFCEGHPGNNCDYPTDVPRSCASNDDCSEPTAVCDVGATMTCVQCTPQQAGACTGATPACGEDRTCRACQAHSECRSSEACLPDGSCAAPGHVAHVKPPSLGGTDNPTCTLAAPCTKVASALATGRPYVKLAGTIDEAVTIENSRVVTFLAEPDAKLTRTNGAGAIVTVRDSGTSLTVYDLSISNAPNDPSGIGIVVPSGAGAPIVSLIRAKVMNNPGGGISASGGALTVSQSTISGNTGGGISVMNGTFVIVGNMFFDNGDNATLVGGVAVGTSQNATNRLEFNSLHANQAQLGVGAAIHCIAGTFTARNNVMSDNGTLMNMEQVGGTCAHAYSIVRPGTLPPGNGNSNMDPLFVNTTTGDLHVKPGSPALGAADPSSDLTGPAERDIDGDVRTRPADIGADEVP
jgi:hypothetical protein